MNKDLQELEKLCGDRKHYKSYDILEKELKEYEYFKNVMTNYHINVYDLKDVLNDNYLYKHIIPLNIS